MLKLTTPRKDLLSQANTLHVSFGGSESNVAIALANLGLKTSLVSALPKSAFGKTALSYLKSFDVGTQHIALGDERMGIYFLEQGAAIRSSKILYDRDHSCFSKLGPGQINWDAIFAQANWFHLSGISAALCQSVADLCLEAIEAAKSKGVIVSLDLNYRRNLWKYGKSPVEIMPELVQHVDVLLSDPNTANVMLGTNLPVNKKYSSAEELKIPYDLLQATYPNLKHISMLLRFVESSDSNVLQGVLYNQGSIFSCDLIKVNPIVERVGGGDSFMAGLVFGLIQRKPLEEVVDIATALSALKLTVKGDVSPFNLEELDLFRMNDKSGSIKR